MRILETSYLLYELTVKIKTYLTYHDYPHNFYENYRYYSDIYNRKFIDNVYRKSLRSSKIKFEQVAIRHLPGNTIK